MIALVWGYDRDYDFNKVLPDFQNAGLDFYVCPGTSTWRSLIGRNSIAFANIYNAAYYGKQYGFLMATAILSSNLSMERGATLPTFRFSRR